MGTDGQEWDSGTENLITAKYTKQNLNFGKAKKTKGGFNRELTRREREGKGEKLKADG